MLKGLGGDGWGGGGLKWQVIDCTGNAVVDRKHTHIFHQRYRPRPNDNPASKAYILLPYTVQIFTYSVTTLLCTTMQLLVNTNIKSANHVAATRCKKVCRNSYVVQLLIRPNIRMGKTRGLNDFDRGMIAGVRGVVSYKPLISWDFQKPLGYREWCGKKYIQFAAVW